MINHALCKRGEHIPRSSNRPHNPHTRTGSLGQLRLGKGEPPPPPLPLLLDTVSPTNANPTRCLGTRSSDGHGVQLHRIKQRRCNRMNVSLTMWRALVVTKPGPNLQGPEYKELQILTFLHSEFLPISPETHREHDISS